MSTNDYIEQVKNEFAAGKRFVEIFSENPFLLRKRLYAAVRRRGLLWLFSICDKSLFISNSVTF